MGAQTPDTSLRVLQDCALSAWRLFSMPECTHNPLHVAIAYAATDAWPRDASSVPRQTACDPSFLAFQVPCLLAFLHAFVQGATPVPTTSTSLQIWPLAPAVAPEMFRCAVPCHAPAGVVGRPMGHATQDSPRQLPRGQTLVLQDYPGARGFFPVGGDPWVRGLEVSHEEVAARAASRPSGKGDSTAANQTVVAGRYEAVDASSTSISIKSLCFGGAHQYGAGSLRHPAFDPATGAVYLVQVRSKLRSSGLPVSAIG